MRRFQVTREYWMIYRRPSFLAVVWFGSLPSASCLSFWVFLCVAGRSHTDGREGFLSAFGKTNFLIGAYFIFYNILFNTASSAAPQIPLIRRKLEWKPGLLRLWRWQSEALTTRNIDSLLKNCLGFIACFIDNQLHLFHLIIVDTKSRFCVQVVIAPAPSVEGGLLAVSDNMFVHNNSKVKYCNWSVFVSIYIFCKYVSENRVALFVIGGNNSHFRENCQFFAMPLSVKHIVLHKLSRKIMYSRKSVKISCPENISANNGLLYLRVPPIFLLQPYQPVNQRWCFATRWMLVISEFGIADDKDNF